jgi:anthranilate synthase component 1
MNFEEFEQLSRSYKVIPVSKSLLADTVSPVSAYLRLRGQNQEPPHGGTTNGGTANAATFLLESVEGGERIARYSFIGRDPLFLVRSSGQTTELVRGGVVEKHDGDLFTLLSELLQQYSQPPHPSLPRFTGGLVGFIGYDAVRSIEKLPCSVVNDAGFEDSILGLFNKIVAFDHLRHQVIIIVNTLVGQEPPHGGATNQESPYGDTTNLRAQYENALAEIASIENMLKTPEQPPARFEHPPASPTAETSREDFEKLVVAGKRYITEGDIFQVVLSQRFSSQFNGDLFNLYRALRVINPSPYLYFLDFGETKIAGSSPEILVRAESGVAEVYPIAGTRPRGATEAQDKAFEKDLLADEKELAEHIMLVDLGRNDLGRVCEIGTVKVSDMMSIVKYSHVMHIASRVTGKMVPGKTCVDVLRATFPAGTVSGAPKIRAMEIIDELESSRRTIYAGGVGYFDFSGNMDFCIAIRTLFAKGSKLYFQAGAGIVADSDPAREFEETLNKSRVIVDAIKLAQEIS